MLLTWYWHKDRTSPGYWLGQYIVMVDARV